MGTAPDADRAHDPWDPAYYGSVEHDAPSTGRDAASRPLRSPTVRRPARRWWALAVVVLIVGGVFFIGADGNDEPAAAPRETVPPISTASNTSGTMSAIPPIGERVTPNTTRTPFPTLASNATSPSTVAASLGPLVTKGSGGRGLYFSDGFGGPNSNLRIDLATGAIVPLPLSYSAEPTIGVVGGGTDVRFVTTADLGGGTAAPCSDGTWWIARTNSSGTMTDLSRVRPRTEPGVAPDLIQTAAINPAWQSMHLTPWTAVGDQPILTAADNGTYALDPSTGNVQRLGSGELRLSSNGLFSEVVCDDAAACITRLHGANGATVTIPASSRELVSFSPDGRHALVAGPDQTPATGITADEGVPLRLQILDFATGAIALTAVTVTPDTDFSSFGSLWAQWMPDGTTAFVFDGTNVIEVDAATATASTHRLPDVFANGAYVLVGLL